MNFNSEKKILFFEDSEISPIITEFITSNPDYIYRDVWSDPKNYNIISGMIMLYWNYLNTTYFYLLKRSLYDYAEQYHEKPDCSVAGLHNRLTDIQDKFLKEGIGVMTNMPPLPDKALWICANTNQQWFAKQCNWDQYINKYPEEPKPKVRKISKEKHYTYTEF